MIVEMMDCDEVADEKDALFEGSGWLLTKNDVIQPCLGDETDLFEENNKDQFIQQSFDEFKCNNYSAKTYEAPDRGRIARLFIRDLLNAPKDSGKYFVADKVPFVKVEVYGTVTWVFCPSTYHHLFVDDGTSCVTCLVKPLDESKVEIARENYDDHVRAYLENKSDDFALAQLIVAKDTKTMVENGAIVYDEDLLGKKVRIIGNLREYNDERFIFVDVITCVSEAEFLKQMNGLVRLYESKKKIIKFH